LNKYTLFKIRKNFLTNINRKLNPYKLFFFLNYALISSVFKNLAMRKILLIGSIFISCISFSQNVDFTKQNFPDDKKELKKIIKLLRKGDYYFYDNDRAFNEALVYFLQANQFNPDNALLNYNIAICYLNTYEKYNALPYAEKAKELDPNVMSDIDYVLGLANHQKGFFDEAIDAFNKHRENCTNPDTLELIRKRIAESEYAREKMKKEDYVVTNLGEVINSEYREYVPLITADESALVFTARKMENKKGKRLKNNISEFDHDFYEHVYRAIRNENGEWQTPYKMPAPVNPPKKHNASISLSLDGSEIYLYSSVNNGDIYTSELNGNEWSKPIPIPGLINTKKYNESHISISYDKKIAYVVSDKPGGMGGKDIWMSEMQDNNTWGELVNLGSPINTPEDEDGVFIHPDGITLYFSSKGHETMGGYDIYESEFKDGAWSTPINMGYPVNSVDDDIYFVLTADGKNAYLSSVKENGYGKQDIYAIRPFEKKVFKEFQMALFKGILKDKATDQLLGGVVSIFDQNTGEKLFSADVNSISGEFVVSLPFGKNYSMNVESPGYTFYTEVFNLERSTEFTEIQKVVYLEKLSAGVKLTLNNINFEFDKAIIIEGSATECLKSIELLNKNPEFKIEIEGHTDNVGDEAYNQKLSEKRASAVKSFMMKKGFPATRIVKVVGYGETKPIDTNDTKEGRAKNRRVELKIVEKK
jgi:outer membrane protein OmpA-like peptidoglycan-associated protein/tetratricopeptide (TPR) repeat protein